MLKIKKSIGISVALLLGIVVIFSVAACAPTDTQAELESKIDQLQSTIEDLQTQLGELNDQMGELNDKNAQLENELERKNELLKKMDIPGGFYSLQEAYDLCLLTTDDLMSIAYYYNGATAYPEALNSQIEDAIKERAAEDLRNLYRDPEITADGFTVIRFYGVYSDNYVVSMDDIYSGYPDVIVDYWEEIGGIGFHHRGFIQPKVWR